MEKILSVTEQAELDQVYKKITLRIVPFLIIGYIAAYLDRANIGYVKADLADELGFSAAVYGMGAGLFYIGYSAFEVPSNLLLKKVGARLTFARIMILWGAISVGFAFIVTPTQFGVMRFLLGAAEAGFFPGVLLYITYWVPGRLRAGITAKFMSALVVSGVVGGLLSGIVIEGMDGWLGMSGWQWLFITFGLPSVFLGVFSLFWLSDSPDKAKWLTDREKEIVLADIANDQISVKSSGQKVNHSLLDTLKDSRIYILGLMAIALISGLGGLFFWMPTIVQNTGVESKTTIGFLTALPYLVALFSQQLVARSSDKHQERRLHVSICAFISGISWILLSTVSDQTWPSMIVLSIIAASGFGATGPFWAMPSSFLTGAAAAGGIAIVTTFGGIVGAISPYVAGWSQDLTGSTDATMYYYGVLYLVGGLAIFFGVKPNKKTT
jgi:sugar phosphate permease